MAAESHPAAGRGPFVPKRMPGVGRVLAVASGKGGVGKSTVAVNLALALARSGRRVGLLDADLQGPSVPLMLALKPPPEPPEGGKIDPVETHGIRVMSTGFLLADNAAAAWRGPMLGKVLQFLFTQVNWGELDDLVLDLPPGTADIQISLAQNVVVDGAILVTTPQSLAFADVRRAASLFQQMDVPLWGIVENMSWFECPDTGKRHYLFGEGRIDAHATELGLEVLARLPLDAKVAVNADNGRPALVAEPEGEQAKLYVALAERLLTPPEQRQV